MGVDGAGAETVDVVVGVSNWVRPGMAVERVFIPRPPFEFPPALDDPGAATPAMGDGLDDVDEVGLERAPASESDVVGVVMVEEDFAGAMALVAVGFSGVESLL